MRKIEREAYAMECAKKRSWSVYNKLPQQLKTIIDVDDISQGMLLSYISNIHTYDTNKPFEPWINTVFSTSGIDAITKAWDSYEQNRQHTDRVNLQTCIEEEGNIAIIDNDTPELLLLRHLEEVNQMEKVKVYSYQINTLAKRFGIDFHAHNPTKTLLEVLQFSLNDMSDEDFDAMPYHIRMQLTQYGDLLSKHNLKIVKSNLTCIGITGMIRECVQKGNLTVEGICKELESKNIIFSKGSVKVVLTREKQRAGIAVKKKIGLLDRVRELFDYGKGVTTTAEMLFILQDRGIPHSPSTVRVYVQELRKINKTTQNYKRKKTKELNPRVPPKQLKKEIGMEKNA